MFATFAGNRSCTEVECYPSCHCGLRSVLPSPSTPDSLSSHGISRIFVSASPSPPNRLPRWAAGFVLTGAISRRIYTEVRLLGWGALTFHTRFQSECLQIRYTLFIHNSWQLWFPAQLHGGFSSVIFEYLITALCRNRTFVIVFIKCRRGQFYTVSHLYTPVC